ncbi:MAG: helix-turn-helix transcriptional regulator [Acidobacteria bacterium]|nr:helix-turn-helix transcriptional regulator [Acidobacteriota bacterium]
MGNSFGDRLRAERLARGLTQAELGGDLYSASYVSLLENGRREPTYDVIQQLAKQLELAPHAVQEWTTPVSEEETSFLLSSLYARQSWDMRDYTSAATHAAQAAELAQTNKDIVSWWNMAYLNASALLKNGEWEAAKTSIGAVLSHPLSQDTPALAVRAEQLFASACLGAGQLTLAAEHASIAVARGTSLAHESGSYISALRTLVGALAESGQLEEAWRYSKILSDLVDDNILPQLAGEIYWVVGNVAFMRHDVEQGLAYHGRAANLLSPANDLALWARFNKATASVRLSAGIVEPDTLEAIERAELAQSVVGANSGDELEVQLIRARWLYLTGEQAQAVEILTGIYALHDSLARHTAGEVALLLGKAKKAIGQTDDALAMLIEAKDHFAAAGASERATLALDNILEIRAARSSA